jgi:hypothetical protein
VAPSAIDQCSRSMPSAGPNPSETPGVFAEHGPGADSDPSLRCTTRDGCGRRRGRGRGGDRAEAPGRARAQSSPRPPPPARRTWVLRPRAGARPSFGPWRSQRGAIPFAVPREAHVDREG